MSEDGLRAYRNRVSLGLGLIQLGRPWGVTPHDSLPSDTEVDALVEEAYGLGIRFFDTAPAYGMSEASLGRTQRARQGDLFIATKYGEFWVDASSSTVVDHSLPSAVRSLTASAALLGKVKLLQVHKCTAEVAGNQQVLEFISLLKSLGMPTGASVSDPQALEAVLQTGLFSAVQFPFNQEDLRFSKYLSRIRSAGILPIINRPFAMGSLAATPELRREAFDFIADHIDEGVVLTGTSRIPHLRENVQAFQKVFSSQ